MKRSFTESNWRSNSHFRKVCRALLSCKTEGEVADFLRDVGTLSELKAWSERLEAASLLQRGSSYRSIAAQTGLSTATITRIAAFLRNGKGYRKALNKIG